MLEAAIVIKFHEWLKSTFFNKNKVFLPIGNTNQRPTVELNLQF